MLRQPDGFLSMTETRDMLNTSYLTDITRYSDNLSQNAIGQSYNAQRVSPSRT